MKAAPRTLKKLFGNGRQFRMRNSAWPIKKEALQEHSHLILNRHLSEHSDWNEDNIVYRGEWLAECVSKAWPGPEHPAWGLSEDG